MQHPVSELAEFYDALSRYLTGGGRDPGGADAYAMHRMLRDPQGRRETPGPHVLNELVAGEIGQSDALAVLDAGCGWGGTLLHLARMRKLPGLGITLSGVQAQTATGAARKFGLSDRLTFVQGDFDRYEFPANGFDAIIGIESIIHCHDKTATIRHLAGSLKTGGRLVMVDDVRPSPDRLENSPEFARFQRLWRLAEVPSEAEWLGIFEQAGLRGRVTRDLTELYAPRPDTEVDRLVAEAERELAGFDDPGASEQYAIEAVLGGYMLEKLYNRKAMRYLMISATRD